MFLGSFWNNSTADHKFGRFTKQKLTKNMIFRILKVKFIFLVFYDSERNFQLVLTFNDFLRICDRLQRLFKTL